MKRNIMRFLTVALLAVFFGCGEMPPSLGEHVVSAIYFPDQFVLDGKQIMKLSGCTFRDGFSATSCTVTRDPSGCGCDPGNMLVLFAGGNCERAFHEHRNKFVSAVVMGRIAPPPESKPKPKWKRR